LLVRRRPRAQRPLSFRLPVGDNGVGARALEEPLAVEARSLQDIDQYGTLREVLGLAPDRGEDRGHVLCAAAVPDGDQRASAEFGEVEGLGVRVSGKIDVVAPGPPLQVRARIFALVLALDGRRPIADNLHQFENAKWVIGNRGAVLRCNPRKLRVG